MIRAILPAFCILYSLAISAADKSANDVKIILEANLPTNCNFSGDFTQKKYLKGLPLPLHSSGQFFFACRYGLIWDVNKPNKETRIYTHENTHFSLSNAEKPVLLEGIANFYLAKFLLSILSGNSKALYNSYDIQQNSSSAITLIPKNKYLKKGLSSIELLKKPLSEKNLITVKITDANQQITEILVSENKQYKEENIIDVCNNTYSDNTCSILKDPSEYEQDEPLY